MSKTSAPRKKRSEIPNAKRTNDIPKDISPRSIRKPLLTEDKGSVRKVSCVPIRESDHYRISMRMSPESRIISKETKWSKTGYIPSFVDTDKILIKAAHRTYKIIGLSTDE